MACSVSSPIRGASPLGLPDWLARARRFMRALSRLGAALVALAVAVGCSNGGPQWADANRRVIEQNKVTGRTREVPDVRVPMALADGEPVEAARLPIVTIAEG